MLRTRFVSQFIATMAICLLSARGFAAPILAGQTILAPAEADPTGGVVQPGTGVAVPFASPPGPGQYSGTLTTTVLKNDPSNPFGGLTFTYRITNDVNSLAVIHRMTNLDFTGFLTDVSYQIPAVGVVPTTVDRDLSDSTIGWTFNPLGAGVIQAGAASALVVIQTNAPAYVPINANLIDGSIAVASSFGPAVPEPASLTLLGISLLSFGALGQRRKRR